MKLVWTCSYDGKLCEYEKVNVKDGEVIMPEPVKEERGIYAPGSWDKCIDCPHSYSIGVSHACLALETYAGLIRL